MIFEFIVTIAQPLWNIIIIGNHAFNMKLKRYTNLINKFVIRLCCNDYCTRNIITQRSTKVFIAPRYIYYYFFHNLTFLFPTDVYIVYGHLWLQTESIHPLQAV